jgi:hypothetical protein
MEESLLNKDHQWLVPIRNAPCCFLLLDNGNRSCLRVHRGRSERGIVRVPDTDRQIGLDVSPSSFCAPGMVHGRFGVNYV